VWGGIGVFSIFVLPACSSIPKSSQEKVSQQEAVTFLRKYCSSFDLSKSLAEELSGEILVHSNTSEFKGSYPASVHFSKDKTFSMEVTNIIGGTVVSLKGDPSAVEIESPGHPKMNRKGIGQYMGLPIPMFEQLLHGDLPCPDSAVTNGFLNNDIKVDGNEIVLHDRDLMWRIERSEKESGSVPVRARIFDQQKLKVELLIESWNNVASFAEKVKVHTDQGDLRWSWRSRNLK